MKSRIKTQYTLAWLKYIIIKKKYIRIPCICFTTLLQNNKSKEPYQLNTDKSREFIKSFEAENYRPGLLNINIYLETKI